MKHLVIPDPHACPGKSNRRAEWIGRLILDIKPDTVVVLGDSADMPSLCSYDRGKKSFIGRTYKKDIDAHGDFQERLWDTCRKGKKRLPRRVTLIGNHEQRIERAIEVQPELEGIIGYNDLQLAHFYDDVVHYEGATPGSIEIDGVTYAHYLVSGISGRPLSGEHHAHAILSKKHSSCVVGHSHLLDYCVRTRQDGRKIMGLVAGCYQEHESSYAGSANKLWWRGVCVLDDVEKGTYNLKTISLEKLRKTYG
jgi:hypothetical protein